MRRDMGADCNGISNPGRLSFAGSSTGSIRMPPRAGGGGASSGAVDDSGTVQHRFGQFVQRPGRRVIAGKLNYLGRGFGLDGGQYPRIVGRGLPPGCRLAGDTRPDLAHSPRVSRTAGAESGGGSAGGAARWKSVRARTSVAAKDSAALAYAGVPGNGSVGPPPRAATHQGPPVAAAAALRRVAVRRFCSVAPESGLRQAQPLPVEAIFDDKPGH